MPGIVGLLTKMPREWAQPQLARMVETLRHESFYETGTWTDEALGVFVGWTARKNSFASGMPMRNERGEVVLVFSGEEYPEPGLIARLKQQGHGVEPEGPSYLVHLYEEDPAFPAGLNGRFHGLLADRRQGTALLFNDRYGMHRIYYYQAPEAFYFAAEAKAILAVRPELRRVDVRSLGEFVACGSVLENRTLFEGVRLLPGAAAWVFRQGALAQQNAYFQPREWEEQGALEPESYYRELRDVFSRNLPRYLQGHEKIGMSLTGGLDTRTVMAWQRLPAGAFPCYTYGGTRRVCRDVRVSRRVASVCRQPHQVIAVGNDFLSRFSHYAERSVYLSDATIDLLRSPDLYLSERARGIAPVRMTGLYGDEVLRHARAFKPVAPTPGLFHAEFLPYIDQAKTTYARLVEGHPLSFAAFRQAPWHNYGILSLEQSQLTVRTPFLDNDLIRTVFRAPESAAANNDMRVRLIGEGNPALGRIRTDLGFGGRPGRLAAETAQRFHRFTFRAEYAYDYGMPQWLAGLDHALSPLHLDRLFLGRHKLLHFRIWYRDQLADYVREMLLDRQTLSRPYLERSGVEAMVRGHLQGNRNYTLAIHKLLTLELLHRLFLESAQTESSPSGILVEHR
jgi:asparagine synthase (glutamine-hydrolysing)